MEEHASGFQWKDCGDQDGMGKLRRCKKCFKPHQVVFADADASEIANAYTRAVYLDHDDSETYFGTSEARFTEAISSNAIVWAPDGDEAFDDSSYILQFDVNDRVRLVAFTCPDGAIDPTTVWHLSLVLLPTRSRFVSGTGLA